MKKKDIINQSLIYTAQADADDYANVDEVRHAFIAGSEWRINSVWHDVEESPKQGSLIAVFDGKDMHLWRAEDIVNVINGIRVVSMTVKECFIRQHIIKWAYIKDLIPNMED